MQDLYQFLSGNVVGGIALYLFLVIAIFLVLYSISRRNDLFTPRHFRVWFLAIWVIVTLAYAALWLRNPPPAAFERYSTIVTPADPGDRWLAFYIRDLLDGQIAANQDGTTYFFRERWHYRGGLDPMMDGGAPGRRVARTLPLDRVVTGRIGREGGRTVLTMELVRFPDEAVEDRFQTAIDPARPDRILPELRGWLSRHLPLRRGTTAAPLPDSALVLARQAFIERDFAESRRRIAPLFADRPDQPEIRRWYYYNRVREALDMRKADATPVNPYDQRKRPWQVVLNEARLALVKMVKERIEGGGEAAMLYAMAAESFMVDEFFGDAEEFLKLGYAADPFSLEVLYRLSLIHESRLADLPFPTYRQLHERILTLCPFDTAVLQQHVASLMLTVQVDNAPSARIERLLNRALTLNPLSVTALVLKGQYLNTTFDYDSARVVFLRADSLDPDNPEILFDLGITHFKLGELERAEDYFQRAVALNDYLDAHLYLGVIYQERGDCERALERYRYRVANKTGDDDYYAVQAMKGIRECLHELGIPIPTQ